MKRIGFVGVGRMGAPMAANLAKAGFELVLYDIDGERAGEVARAIGARATDSLGEIGACDAVVTMLQTSDQVQDVLIRAQGGAFLGAARPGTIVVDMSSSEPTTTLATGALLAETGVILIDAPVSGGVMRAEAGTLTIMIGADDPAAVDAVAPLLEAMGQQLFRVGRLGAGDAMKAANNYAAAATYVATAEALSMGKRFGLDPQTMVDIINVSTGRSFVSELVMKEHVVTGRYATGFGLGLITKDVGIAARLGEELGLDAPLSHLVFERLKQSVEGCAEDADHSEAILSWYPDLWEKDA